MNDTLYMDRAVALARRAEGRTSPNPMVGCVIVADGQVVGEGWHQGPGTPHAEVAALAVAGELAQGATAYVTLEPCNHHGNTPPCSEALLAAGIGTVVYGAADPNPVAAGGADMLREAGLTVRYADHAEAQDLVRPWVHFIQNQRPYVYAKLAMSLDGRTATRSGESKWITGDAARARGHDLRQLTDAIIVGVGTVLADDPSLDPRPEGREASTSLKVICDTRLQTPKNAKLFSSPGSVLIACDLNADQGRRAALESAGAEILPLPLLGGRPTLEALVQHLGQRDITSVMIEGGGTLLGAAFDAGLVDEVWAFVAPLIIGGGQTAIKGNGPAALADALRLHDIEYEQLGGDFLIRGRTEKTEAACLQAL